MPSGNCRGRRRRRRRQQRGRLLPPPPQPELVLVLLLLLTWWSPAVLMMAFVVAPIEGGAYVVPRSSFIEVINYNRAYVSSSLFMTTTGCVRQRRALTTTRLTRLRLSDDDGDTAPSKALSEAAVAADVLSTLLRGRRNRGTGTGAASSSTATPTRMDGHLLGVDGRSRSHQGPDSAAAAARRAWHVLRTNADDKERHDVVANSFSSSITPHQHPEAWGPHLESLGTRRWNDCVQACLRFDLDNVDDGDTDSNGTARWLLLDALCNRLCQGDALSRLSATELSHTLWNWALASRRSSKAAVRSTAPSDVDSSSTPTPSAAPLVTLIRAYCRRLRKKSIRSQASRNDLMRALRAARIVLDPVAAPPTTTRRVNGFTHEMSTMAYTVAHEVVLRATDENRTTTGSGAGMSSSPPPLALSGSDLSTLWSIVGVFQLSANDLLVQRLVACHSQQIQERIRTSKSLDAGTECVDSGHVDEDSYRSTITNLVDIATGIIQVGVGTEIIVQNVGEQFRIVAERSLNRSLVQDGGATTSLEASTIDPRSVQALLRPVALLHAKNLNVVQPFADSLRLLLIGQGESSSHPSAFLNHTTLWDVSNLAWFLSRVHCSDHNMIEVLARAALHKSLEADVQDEKYDDKDDNDDEPVTLSCRILVYFASLFGQRQSHSDSSTCTSLLADLFERFGPTILLSPRELSPRELSSLIHAYAKANYVQDMGIYDHLVGMVGCRVDELSVRQLAQCLWSCGRMSSWEELSVAAVSEAGDVEVLDIDAGSSAPPPYRDAALAMADALALRSEELNAPDVTQALWALGHLLVSGLPPYSTKAAAASIQKLSRRVKELNEDLRPREVANILSALGRLSSSRAMVSQADFDVVYALTRRFVVTGGGARRSSDPSALPFAVNVMTPQECALIMQAMARLDVRDADLFSNLSIRLLECVDQASAQSISVALWSHRAVHLTPPSALMDRWASKRLGLSPVVPVDVSALSSWSSSYEYE